MSRDDIHQPSGAFTAVCAHEPHNTANTIIANYTFPMNSLSNGCIRSHLVRFTLRASQLNLAAKFSSPTKNVIGIE
jgi:hypothetical protein